MFVNMFFYFREKGERARGTSAGCVLHAPRLEIEPAAFCRDRPPRPVGTALHSVFSVIFMVTRLRTFLRLCVCLCPWVIWRWGRLAVTCLPPPCSLTARQREGELAPSGSVLWSAERGKTSLAVHRSAPLGARPRCGLISLLPSSPKRSVFQPVPLCLCLALLLLCFEALSKFRDVIYSW